MPMSGVHIPPPPMVPPATLTGNGAVEGMAFAGGFRVGMGAVMAS